MKHEEKNKLLEKNRIYLDMRMGLSYLHLLRCIF